jgi:multicomponent Na+:H+ antiporter subunit F
MNIVFSICLIGLALSVLLGFYRLAKGPSVLDRILAFDVIAVCSVGIIIILSMQWQTPYYLELILIFSLLGFFGTVAFVFYLHKTYSIEAGDEGEIAASSSSEPPLDDD